MRKTYRVVLTVSIIITLLLVGDLRGMTALSQKASQLKMGMTREAVIRLLGSPTWASIPGDTGEFAIPAPQIALELFWRNPDCAPVVVDFDYNLRVIGWDEGRAICGKDAHLFQPSEEYSCNKSDRAKFCK
jgi:hypothetical protein